MEINVNVSKLVKPSIPTPSTLHNYELSFFDEKPGNVIVPLVLYYSTSHKKEDDIQTNIFNHLEISLSETLTSFYPLAGRYTRGGSFIDCRDQGALFVQAKAKFQLSEFLALEQKLKTDKVQDFLPFEVGNVARNEDPLLYVQVTSFECGGVAIGICFSHKFADMDTICKFIDNWAARSREVGNELQVKVEKYSRVTSAAHLFPKTTTTTTDAVVNTELDPNSLGITNCILRVFTFKGSAIQKLRGELMSNVDSNIIRHRPSKVQLIVALLWKALVDIDRRNGQSKASFVGQAVNMRNIVAPESFCGNYVSFANTQIELNEVINLQVLVKLLHESVTKIKSDLSHSEKDYEVLSKPFMEIMENILRNDVSHYFFSSWCRFSFYTADFGWGKPVWRGITNQKISNCVNMMDDEEGDGVEAWVHLDEKQMGELEKDPNIQLYMDI